MLRLVHESLATLCFPYWARFERCLSVLDIH
jgi:hypothetical protein